MDTLTQLAINVKHTITETTPGNVSVGPLAAPGAALALHGAAPNPFRGRTRVMFSTAAPGHVRVELFDTGGRRVATPLDAVLGAGRHEAAIDGSRLEPGLYFYRVTANGAVRPGRLLRIR